MDRPRSADWRCVSRFGRQAGRAVAVGRGAAAGTLLLVIRSFMRLLLVLMSVFTDGMLGATGDVADGLPGIKARAASADGVVGVAEFAGAVVCAWASPMVPARAASVATVESVRLMFICDSLLRELKTIGFTSTCTRGLGCRVIT